MIANPCAPSARLNRTPKANVLILLFLSASSVPWKVQLETLSVFEAPPAGGIGGRCRDNTRGKIESHSTPQHVHAPLTKRKIAPAGRLSIFLYNQSLYDFRFGIFELTSSRQAGVNLFIAATVAEFLVSA